MQGMDAFAPLALSAGQTKSGGSFACLPPETPQRGHQEDAGGAAARGATSGVAVGGVFSSTTMLSCSSHLSPLSGLV
jgi:hypothetical protein